MQVASSKSFFKFLIEDIFLIMSLNGYGYQVYFDDLYYCFSFDDMKDLPYVRAIRAEVLRYIGEWNFSSRLSCPLTAMAFSPKYFEDPLAFKFETERWPSSRQPKGTGVGAQALEDLGQIISPLISGVGNS